MTTVSFGTFQAAITALAANPSSSFGALASGIESAASNIANGLSNSAASYEAMGRHLMDEASRQANIISAFAEGLGSPTERAMFQEVAHDIMSNVESMRAEGPLAYQRAGELASQAAAQTFRADLAGNGAAIIELTKMGLGALEGVQTGNWDELGKAAGGTLGGALGGWAGFMVGVGLAALFPVAAAPAIILVTAGAAAYVGDAYLGEIIYNGYKAIGDFVRDEFLAAWGWLPPRDPLVLDLDGDGIETLALDPAAPVLFDHDGDGRRTGTGWIRGDDGLLALDLDGNGLIDSGKELFGDNTALPGGGLAANGFQALAQHDANADGRIDAADTVYSALRVWRDVNADGVSQSSELYTLGQLGIASIGVAGQPVNVNLGGGNTQTWAGTFTRTNGQSGNSGAAQLTGSLVLGSDNFHREFTDDPPLTEAARQLPQMEGSGFVRDLRQATSLATANGQALQARLQAFASATTRDEQMAQLDDLISSWAGSSDRLVSSVFRYSMVMDGDVLVTADRTQTSYRNIELRIHPQGLEQTVTNPHGEQEQVPTEAGNEVLRRLNVLEIFNGQKFFSMAPPPPPQLEDDPPEGGGGGYISPVIPVNITLSSFQIEKINSSYAALQDSIYSGLVLQTRLQPYLQKLQLVFGDDGSVTVDATQMLAALEARHATDARNAFIDTADLVRYTDSALHYARQACLSQLREWFDAAPPDAALRDELRALGIFTAGWGGGTARGDAFLGGAAADSFLAGNGHDVLSGAAGNDNLQGQGGDDILDGGAGNDVLIGGWWSDAHNYIDGFGNDTYLFGRGDGNDSVWDRDSTAGAVDKIVFKAGVLPSQVQVLRLPDSNGNVNNLTLRIADTGEQVTVTNYFYNEGTENLIEEIHFTDAPGTVWTVGHVRGLALIGGAGNDQLTGYWTADALRGNDGNDSMGGRGGYDTLYGGAGSDAMYGEDGNDVLYGEEGNDLLQGQGGDDVLDGGAGNDTLVGGWWSDAHNYIDGFGNDTYAFGRGDGNDTVWDRDATAGAIDRIVFKAGVLPSHVQVLRLPDSNGNLNNLTLRIADTGEQVTVVNYFYNNGTENLIEQIHFVDAPFTIWSVADVKALALIGGAGNDNITGYETADVLRGNGGGDSMGGRAGNDTLYGGAGNDAMYGDEGNDTLYGEEGNDLLQGQGGDDVLDGGTGNDTLIGGWWSDAHSYIDGFGNDTYLFGRGDGNDNVWDKDGTAGAIDRIVFKAGVLPAHIQVLRLPDANGNVNNLTLRIADTGEQVVVTNYFYNDGTEHLIEEIRFADDPSTVWSVADVKATALVGGAGGDTLTGYGTADVLRGNDGNDGMRGRGGDDTLHGGAGQDSLSGDDGNDTLNGDLGNDALFGGGGDDILDGGAGNDQLAGGFHDPNYTWYDGAGNDTYLFGRGGGQDWISDRDGTAGNADRIQFGGGIAAADLRAQRIGNDLVLGIAGSADQITVWRYFESAAWEVEEFRLSDQYSTVLRRADVDAALANGGLFPSGIVQGGSGTLTGTAHSDTLTAEAYGTTLQGLAGNDILQAVNGGSIFDLQFNGGTGNDTLIGSYARDFYHFNLGDGQDRIIDDVGALGQGTADYFAMDPGNTNYHDEVRFGTGIAWEGILRSRVGNDLVLSVNGGPDRITIADWFDGTNANKIERFVFADGGPVRTTVDAEQGLPGVDVTAHGILWGTASADNLVADWADARLFGGAGNDTLGVVNHGAIFNVTFNGGAGNDTIVGSYARDAYQFQLGDGHDRIRDDVGVLGQGTADYFAANPGDANYHDELRFGAGITWGSIQRSRSGNDLVLTLDAASDSITIEDWFDGSNASKIERFVFADGSERSAADAEQGLPGVNVTGHGTLWGTASADTMTADWANARLFGGADNDTLGAVVDGAIFDLLFNGGAGNDTIAGSYARDVYQFQLGDGHDLIRDDVGALGQGTADYFAANPGDTNYQDELRFGAGITWSGIQRSRSGDSLVLTLNVGADSITIADWFDGSNANKIEKFTLINGVQYTIADAELGLPGVNTTGHGTLWGTSSADTLVADWSGTKLMGGAGNDTLGTVVDGAVFDLRFSGGAGNDTITGSYARDVYQFNLGDGQDVVTDDVASLSQAVADFFASDPSNPNYRDELWFGTGIQPADIQRLRVDDDLVLRINGTSDQVTVNGWFDGTVLRKIELVGFANGTTWGVGTTEAGL